MQRAIELLRCAIIEKEFPMKVAQTRLDERSRRICVEVCNDAPMKGSVARIEGPFVSFMHNGLPTGQRKYFGFKSQYNLLATPLRRGVEYCYSGPNFLYGRRNGRQT